MNAMKWLLVLMMSVFTSHQSFAVGNVVIGDLGKLKKIGFEFTNVRQSDEGLVTFNLVIPSSYTFTDGEFKYTKDFFGVSYLRTLKAIEHGPLLISAPATRFNLRCRELEDSRHVTTVTLKASDTKHCYFAVSFGNQPGTWPKIIHIPVPQLLKQLK